MAFSNAHSDDAILRELGQRITRYRLNRNLTQSALAEEAGVSPRTINRVEHGESTHTTNIIRILRVLRLLENFESLIPAPAISPIQQVKMQGKERRRASSPADKPKPGSPWTWEDDE